MDSHLVDSNLTGGKTSSSSKKANLSAKVDGELNKEDQEPSISGPILNNISKKKSTT